MRQNYLAQTVTRALTILSYFTDETPEWGALDLSRRVELPQSTVHRLLLTMEALGYVQRAKDSGRFRLGLTVIGLAGTALGQLDLYRHGYPAAAALAQRTELSATVGVLHAGHVMYLVRVEGGHMLPGRSSIGMQIPIFCSAVGLTLVSGMPDETVMALLEQSERIAYTARTVTDIPAIMSELHQVRSRGYAYDTGEFAEHLRALAVPVHGPGGELAASLALSGPSGALSEAQIPQLLPQLQTAAASLSFALGNARAYV